MYILNMVIKLYIVYNNVITAIRYRCTYYVSTGCSHTIASIILEVISSECQGFAYPWGYGSRVLKGMGRVQEL
jgi:hypothetical protein